MLRRGILVTFEGIDGSGKTTQINMLVDWFCKNGISYKLFREPGGTLIGEKIREILLDKGSSGMYPATELFLYSASRYQLTRERIIPALEEGYVVICDRYYDSSTAYQGYGRDIDLDFIYELNKFASCGIEPDVTFLLDITVEEREKRLAGRSLDRLELEDRAFQERVRKGFLELAGKYGERFVVLDGIKAPQEIFEEVVRSLEPLLGKKRLV